MCVLLSCVVCVTMLITFMELDMKLLLHELQDKTGDGSTAALVVWRPPCY